MIDHSLANNYLIASNTFNKSSYFYLALKALTGLPEKTLIQANISLLMSSKALSSSWDSPSKVTSSRIFQNLPGEKLTSVPLLNNSNKSFIASYCIRLKMFSSNRRDTIIGLTNPTPAPSPIRQYYIIFCSMYPYLLGKECRYALYKVRTKSLIMRQCSVDCRVHSEVMPTEYTQSGNGHFLSYIPSWWKNQPSLVRVGVHAPYPPTQLYLPSHKSCVYAPADTLHLFLRYLYMYSEVMPPPPHPPTFYLSFAVLTVHRILHSQYAQSFHNLHNFSFFKWKHTVHSKYVWILLRYFIYKLEFLILY